MKKVKSKWSLIVAVLLYILFAAYLFQFYRYQIYPDTISYISIAQKYLSGEFSLAINGYWSPLFSWLTIPFLILGFEPLIAAKLVILIVGVFTVLGIGILVSKLRIERKIRFVVIISSVPLILSFAFRVISPDLLTVCTLIYYLIFVLDKDYTKKRKIALWAGFFGALAYLSKTYNFFFFLVHFSLLNIILYFLKGANKRKRVMNSFIYGISIFFFVSGVWIFSISLKYDKFTIGTSGKYNHAIFGPESQGHPTHYQGFLLPPDEKAISAWDDPSYFVRDSWSPFSSKENFKHQIGIINKNIKAFPSFYLICACSVFFALCFFILNSFKKGFFKDVRELFIISAILIYPTGYFLTAVEKRYLWLLSILIVLVGGYILTNLFSSKFFNKSIKRVMLVFFSLSVLFSPLKFFQNPLYKYIDRDTYRISNALRKYNIDGKVATNKIGWPLVLYLAYYLEFKFYGEVSPEAEANEYLLKNDLKKFNIDYFIVVDGKDYRFLKDYKELTKKDLPGLKVYDLKK